MPEPMSAARLAEIRRDIEGGRYEFSFDGGRAARELLDEVELRGHPLLVVETGATLSKRDEARLRAQLEKSLSLTRDSASDCGCPSWRWRWNRMEVRRCSGCGTWWQAQPASLTRVGGWYRINRVQVWWARRRGRVVSE